MGGLETGGASAHSGTFRTIADQLDPRALPALLAAFTAGANDRLDRLSRASGEEERETFLQILHALRGSAGSYGAGTLADACAALERRAARGEALRSIQPDVDELRGVVDDTVTSMRAVLVELGVS